SQLAEFQALSQALFTDAAAGRLHPTDEALDADTAKRVDKFLRTCRVPQWVWVVLNAAVGTHADFGKRTGMLQAALPMLRANAELYAAARYEMPPKNWFAEPRQSDQALVDLYVDAVERGVLPPLDTRCELSDDQG